MVGLISFVILANAGIQLRMGGWNLNRVYLKHIPFFANWIPLFRGMTKLTYLLCMINFIHDRKR